MSTFLRVSSSSSALPIPSTTLLQRAQSSLNACVPYALPYIVSAQEITGSGSIIVAIAAEWMISSSGLGYIINRAMQQYRGDQVYAVALLAAVLSFLIYTIVHVVGERLNWQDTTRERT